MPLGNQKVNSGIHNNEYNKRIGFLQKIKENIMEFSKHKYVTVILVNEV